jgi:hypothetical protein
VVGDLLRSAHRVPPPGQAQALLGEAQRVAEQRGVTLEAYPVHPRAGSRDDTLWFGTASLFEAAGFTTVARPKPTRCVLRWAPSG